MTMHWIAGQRLVSSTQLTFDNIPQTFSHLQIRISGRDASATSNNSGFVIFNGAFDSYRGHSISGNGSTASTGTTTTVLIPLPPLPGTNASANIVGSLIVDIFDYTNVNKNKTIKAIGGCDLNGSGVASFNSGFRSNTGTINSVTVGGAFTAPYLYAAGTRVDLYGITNNPIATGA